LLSGLSSSRENTAVRRTVRGCPDPCSPAVRPYPAATGEAAPSAATGVRVQVHGAHGVRGACAARSLRSAGRDADAELPTVKRAAGKASRCVWAWCMQQCTAFSGQVSARWIMGPAKRQPCTAHVEKRRGRQRGTAHRSTRTWMQSMQCSATAAIACRLPLRVFTCVL